MLTVGGSVYSYVEHLVWLSHRQLTRLMLKSLATVPREASYAGGGQLGPEAGGSYPGKIILRMRLIDPEVRTNKTAGTRQMCS